LIFRRSLAVYGRRFAWSLGSGARRGIERSIFGDEATVEVRMFRTVRRLLSMRKY